MTRHSGPRCTSAVVALAVALQVSIARAQPIDPQPWHYDATAAGRGPSWKAKRTWYGWQILGTSLVGHTLAFASLANSSVAPTLVPLGFGVFALGGPAVHWAHGHVARGFGSLGLNLGSAFATGMIGAGIACVDRCGQGGFSDLYGVVGFAIGLPIGTLIATAIDAGALAWDEEEPAQRASSARAPFWASVVPVLSMSSRHGLLGARAAF